MQLADKDIIKFQTLYKKYFRQEISRDVAMEKGVRLIRLMQIIIKNNKNKHDKSK